MTIEELIIIGIATHHYFEVASYQQVYIHEKLGFTKDEAEEFLEGQNSELIKKVMDKNFDDFNNLLQNTHKGTKGQV